MVSRDRLYQSHKSKSTKPETKPTADNTTNVMYFRSDEISVVSSVTVKLKEEDTKNIARFKKTDSGDPRSRSSSSASDTSNMFSRSILARLTAGRKSPLLSGTCLYRGFNRSWVTAQVNHKIPISSRRSNQPRRRCLCKASVEFVLLPTLITLIIKFIEQLYVCLLVEIDLNDVTFSKLEVIMQKVHKLSSSVPLNHVLLSRRKVCLCISNSALI